MAATLNQLLTLVCLNLLTYERAEYSARQLQMAEEMMAVAQSQRGHDFVVSKSLIAQYPCENCTLYDNGWHTHTLTSLL
jgi:hypothetical protein